MADNRDIKTKIEELARAVSMPGYSSFRKSSKQKILEALRTGSQFAGDLYKNTTGRMIEYRDKFSKTGHNIIENSKKLKK